MNRETELHFGSVPQITQQRSKFDISNSVKTSFNAGDLVVLKSFEILPGDTIEMDMATVIRAATPIFPVMDNSFLSVYAFYVPNRLVWSHWEEFWGQNEDPWTQQIEYQVPKINSGENGFAPGSLADYLGYPTLVPNIEVGALEARAYCKIWNDWFRDENLKKCAHIYTDDTNRTAVQNITGDYVTDTELLGPLCKSAKIHDMFTSCLPSPQKGPAVTLPLGEWAPVGARWNTNYNDPKAVPTTLNPYPNVIDQYGKPSKGMKAITTTAHYQGTPGVTDPTGSTLSKIDRGIYNEGELTAASDYLGFNNLWTDLSQATAATINQLRTAFAIQKYYEAAGRNGTRYIEYLRSVFGVQSSDARLQMAEYLGGTNININIDQVLQTSSTDAVTPQGNTAAFSCTVDKDNLFTKSFEEHGYLMILGTLRTEHTYQQGIPKRAMRFKWTDFYNPYFANLGEMAITNDQIYAQGTSEDKEAFGYQEAWVEYRTEPNTITGAMRSNTPGGSLDAWHYADNYSSCPRLSSSWIDETTANIDRTIAVTSQLAHQFWGDIYFKMSRTACMPAYSIPGLIDHV